MRPKVKAWSDEHTSCFAATRDARRVRGLSNSPLDPSRRAFGPPQEEGGWRAERRKSYGSCLAARGRLSARHMRSWCSDKRNMSTCGVIRRRPRFRRKCPAAILCPVGVPLLRIRSRERRSPAFGIDLTVVSQLLAGSRNGPGGSPTPPRVTCRLSKSRRGTAPRPASRRLMRTPLKRTRWEQCKSNFVRGNKSGE